MSASNDINQTVLLAEKALKEELWSAATRYFDCLGFPSQKRLRESFSSQISEMVRQSGAGKYLGASFTYYASKMTVSQDANILFEVSGKASVGNEEKTLNKCYCVAFRDELEETQFIASIPPQDDLALVFKARITQYLNDQDSDNEKGNVDSGTDSPLSSLSSLGFIEEMEYPGSGASLSNDVPSTNNSNIPVPTARGDGNKVIIYQRWKEEQKLKRDEDSEGWNDLVSKSSKNPYHVEVAGEIARAIKDHLNIHRETYDKKKGMKGAVEKQRRQLVGLSDWAAEMSLNTYSGSLRKGNLEYEITDVSQEGIIRLQLRGKVVHESGEADEHLTIVQI